MALDVAIIGAGPAGSAAAIYCRRAGLNVAIVAPRNRPRRRFELPETLPPSARTHFEELNLWNEFQRAAFREHHCTASAWGSATLTERQSICNPFGSGWYLDRPIFDALLLRTAMEHAAPVIAARVLRAARRRGAWSLTLDEEPGSLEARVIIDASGRSSAFARRIGIGRHSFDRQICVVARCWPAASAGSEALIESAPNGWWFSAPAHRGELAVAYFTDADLLEREYRSAAGWHDLLQTGEHTNARVRRVILETLRTRLASSDHLEQTAGEGWFAVGDAAQASDPLASQGILRALESARAVCDSIREYLDANTNGIARYQFFQTDLLKRFLRERQYFYSVERRWPHSSYWRRRASMPTEEVTGNGKNSVLQDLPEHWHRAAR